MQYFWDTFFVYTKPITCVENILNAEKYFGPELKWKINNELRRLSGGNLKI